MPTPFNGSLRSSEIFGAIYNMILAQEVFADNVKSTSSKLVDRAKVDVGLYGDTKLYYFTDVLKTHTWGDSSQANGYGLATEASNLLSLDRPSAPFCQPVVIDTFKQIRITVDDYLSKRAWADEYAFAQFNSVLLGWLSTTRKVYESTLYNSFIGKTESAINGQTVTLTAPTASATQTEPDVEAYNRLYAEAVAEGIANEMIVLTDINRVNDLAYMRSWDYDDLVVVWNSAVAEKLKRVDMPTIFHKDGLIEKFEEVVLPERYFSTPASASVTVANYIAGTTTAYAAKELDAVYGTGTAARTIHYFPSEPIAKSVQALNSTSSINLVSVQAESDANPTTTLATTAINTLPATQTVCKIMHKDSVPMLSAFETGTSFFNPRSLTENHYLTFGHNTLDYLKGMPFVTVKM